MGWRAEYFEPKYKNEISVVDVVFYMRGSGAG